MDLVETPNEVEKYFRITSLNFEGSEADEVYSGGLIVSRSEKAT